MFNLIGYFAVTFAPVAPTPPPAPPIAHAAPAPVQSAPEAPVPVTTGAAATVNPGGPEATVGAQPIGQEFTHTATVCTVTWISTQTNPVNGQSGTYPVTFYGNCAVADQLASELGGTVTQTPPFTYTTNAP